MTATQPEARVLIVDDEVDAGEALSEPKILDHVWRYDFGGDAGVVESYVSYLRRKVDTTEPKLLHTLRGVGYVLRRPQVSRT